MSEESLSNISNIIGQGTNIKGDIITAGNLRVEGRVEGSVQTKARAALGKTSVVVGNIIAQNAEVSGEVQGSVRVSDLLTLKPTAVINGDIIAGKLVFEEGAKFNGKCNMGGAVKSITQEKVNNAKASEAGSSQQK